MTEQTAAQEAHALGAVTMAEAARQLDVPTREIIEAVMERRIRFVMVRGIAHIPQQALKDYPAKAS
jgi:excisionase family DNA binding protein